jgi:protein TonB
LAAKPTPVPQPVVEIPEPTPLPEPVPEVFPPPAPVAEAPKPAPSLPPAPTPPHPADYLNNPKPSYPALSKRLGEEGTVRLNILVNPDGSVARLELERSSGHPRLDRSAMDTVQSSWKFEPARQGGKPVAAWVIVPIQFTLRS